MYVVTEFDSWSELKDLFGRRPLWGYRGQNDFKWPLETNIYRQAALNRTSDLCLLSREEWVLYQFRRFAHHYRDSFGQPETTLDWLSLIQHYGGPTRLLDFTWSLYVAAFYATESARTDAAIWVVNTPVVEGWMHERLKFFARGDITEIRKAHNEKFDELLGNPTDVPAVILVEPDQMHERMWTQQGFFISPTHPNRPFMENYSLTVGINERATKNAKTRRWTDELEKDSWESVTLVKIRLPVGNPPTS